MEVCQELVIRVGAYEVITRLPQIPVPTRLSRKSVQTVGNLLPRCVIHVAILSVMQLVRTSPLTCVIRRHSQPLFPNFSSGSLVVRPTARFPAIVSCQSKIPERALFPAFIDLTSRPA